MLVMEMLAPDEPEAAPEAEPEPGTADTPARPEPVRAHGRRRPRRGAQPRL